MRKVLFSIMAISFLFCLYNFCITLCSVPSEKERIVCKLETKVAKKLKEELGLIPFGVGGQMMNQIQILMLDFQYRQPISMKEGRRLLVKAVFEYLNEINSNETIRKYLQRYPFQPRNVEICIYLKKSDGSDYGLNELVVLAAREGKIQFKFNKTEFLFRTIQETFEEALEILAEEDSKTILLQPEEQPREELSYGEVL